MNSWIVELIARGGYWGIAFLMALENIIPPIPSEVIMGLGGIAVEQGRMAFWPLLFAGTVGAVLGNYGWFWIGRRLGYERMRPLVGRYGRWLTLEWEDVEGAAAFFRRHGEWMVLFARMTPFFRTMISLPAGASGMGMGRFFLFTAVGSAGWNAVLVWGGMVVGRHFEDELERFSSPVVIALVVIGLGLYGWRVATWKPRAQR